MLKLAVSLPSDIPSHFVLICCKTLVVFVFFSVIIFVSATQRARPLSLLRLLHAIWYCVPSDNNCSALLFVLSAVSSCSWFCFIFIFFYLIFLCSSPDCMLVSQATFQSKHYSFFCSSNSSVPTFPPCPTSCLVSCSVEMSQPCLQCFTLNPACSHAHCNRYEPHLHPQSWQMDSS